MSKVDQQDPAIRKPSGPDRKSFWKPLAWGVILGGLLFTGWLYYPTILKLLAPPALPTSQPTPASTTLPTRTPTISPSPTLEPTITPTPLPVSRYFLSNGWELQPPIRGVEGGLIVLDEATSATVEPGFDTPFWVSSEQIASESGFDIREPYYATFGSGAITWETDVGVAPGIYEIYVMDTLYSSAGPLDFQVRSGGSELSPIIGSTHVEFLSVRGEPPQRTDRWRSLGIYQTTHLEKLTISTAWERRDERTLVAVDRVAIVPLPDSTLQLLTALPLDRRIVIIDNLAADIETAPLLYQETGPLSWGNQYQYVINPSQNVRVVYTAPEHLPQGQYQAAAWIPADHAQLEANYTLLVNDTPIANDAGELITVIRQSDYSGGQWVNLGTWTTPRIYEKPVQISLRMEFQGGFTGEGAFDAIALIYMEIKEQE